MSSDVSEWDETGGRVGAPAGGGGAGAADAGADPGAGIGKADRRRIVIASMVGTTIEFYDFYIYATAAVSVFPLLFFPKGNSTTALLASLATFGLAFVARPLGSILFGHFGDRVGRKATLVGSLLTMGIATFLIGVLPTYHAVGVLAPGLLALMRFFQGLGLGGEWSGAALLATETAAKGKRAWAAMWPQLGAPIGFFFANGVFLILTLTMGNEKDTHGAFLTWGWRIPFLISSVIVILGLYVRLKLEETPVFASAVARGEKVKTPLAEVFKTHWRQLLIGTFVMLATYTLFYVMTTWILGYGTGKVSSKGADPLAMSYRDFLVLQLISVLFFGAGIPVTGWLADRFGRRRVLIVVTIAIALFGLGFGVVLNPDTMTEPIMLSVLIAGMLLMGLTFGPMSAVLPELFPTNVRYTGSGIAYNAASIIGAAVAPFIATWLAGSYGVGWVGVYLSVAALLTLVALLVMRETRDVPLDR